ncbi:hypothetical protein [Kribbella sp. HUAS MG21]|uniref:PKD domain-containing protein n=1 Tax=Kribbella sp. HUAS MG21 TaxID=3160966 RepID=A0AAU7TGT2_9ACTN
MIAVVLAAGFVLLIPPVTASAGVVPQIGSARANNPPVIDSKTTTSGVQVGGKERKRNRLDVNGPATKKPRPTSAPTRTQPFPLTNDTTNAVDPTRKTRLNIGICGRLQNDGTIPGPTRCQPFVPDKPEQRRRTPEVRPTTPVPREITWEDVRSETKDVMFPALTVRVQPRGRTLVNLDTIVYTDDNGVTANWVTVLGRPVLVEATPRKFIWSFGDGTSVTTTSPGKPYPSKEITHKYMKVASVNLTVTVTYTARFFVSDAGWRNVDGLVSITGPATPLQVREAVPVLVDPGR